MSVEEKSRDALWPQAAMQQVTSPLLTELLKHKTKSLTCWALPGRSYARIHHQWRVREPCTCSTVAVMQGGIRCANN